MSKDLEAQAKIDSLRVDLVKVLGELQISQKHACEQAVRANDAEEKIKELQSAKKLNARLLDEAEEQVSAMREAILYALDIKNRQHMDDYAYDDCWGKLRKAIGLKP